MTYFEFLEIAINHGIKGVKITYSDSKVNYKLEGSIAGFQACRNKTPLELIEIFNEVKEYAMTAFIGRCDPEKYWWFRHYEIQVEWICDIVSAMLQNQGGSSLLPHLPTTRGAMKAASILGIKEK